MGNMKKTIDEMNPYAGITPVQLAEAEREIIRQYDETLLARANFTPSLPDGPVRNQATFGDMVPPDSAADRLRLVESSIRLHSAYVENVHLAGTPTPSEPQCSPQELIQRVQEYAPALGLSAIAYTDIPQKFIFSGKTIPFSKAFLFTQAMDVGIFNTAPHVNVQVHVADIYGSLGSIANQMALFIRKSGYPAIPNPALAGSVLYPPLAAYAGLGYPGRNGLLISPDNGPCQRIGAVFVDLPVEVQHAENPHTWIDAFCQKCGKCIRKCPSGAIREIPEMRSNDRPSCTDYEKCSMEYKTSFSCGICVKVCPFTTGSYEKLKNRFF